MKTKDVFESLVTEAVKLPKRSPKYGVGKYIGGKLYLHRMYDNVLPPEVLNNAKRFVGDFDYDIVTYDAKTGNLTFTQSPDFDTAPELAVGDQMVVKSDGKVRRFKATGDPWIYHHKWLMVNDDYPGFDVEESKQRSLDWMAQPDIDYSRIGKRSFWEKNVTSKLD